MTPVAWASWATAVAALFTVTCCVVVVLTVVIGAGVYPWELLVSVSVTAFWAIMWLRAVWQAAP